MPGYSSFRLQSRSVFAFVAAVISATATQSASASAAEPPGVARISYLTGGNVDIVDPETNAAAGSLNAPLFEGDLLDTDDGAFTEIALSPHQRVRLATDSELRLSSLDPQRRGLQVGSGTVEMSVLPGAHGAYPDIDTPSLTMRPLSAGLYRISVDDQGVTSVTVRTGILRVFTPDAEQDLSAGVTEIASGSAQDPQIQSVSPVDDDAFDQFNRDRDHAIRVAFAREAEYAAEVDGLADLDGRGAWRSDLEYGQVWVPNEPDGWAPYHDGRWVWEPNGGWTWVGAEAWGWAPYHYGRWFYRTQLGWAWYPPARTEAVPAWSPALVGFVSINLSFGPSIAWVPLAPREAWHPWGGGTTVIKNTYYNNVQNTYIQNNTNVVYRNLQVQNAVVAVSQTNFTHGNFSRRVAVGATDLRRAQSFTQAIPVTPAAFRNSFSGRAPVQRVAPASVQRHFTEAFARHPVYRGVSLPKAAVPEPGHVFMRKTERKIEPSPLEIQPVERRPASITRPPATMRPPATDEPPFMRHEPLEETQPTHRVPSRRVTPERSPKAVLRPSRAEPHVHHEPRPEHTPRP